MPNVIEIDDKCFGQMDVRMDTWTDI